MNRANHINIHIVSDTGKELTKELNATICFEINYLLSVLDTLIEYSNITISKLNSKMLIANQGKRMISMTLKDNNITWDDLLSYRLISNIYRI